MSSRQDGIWKTIDEVDLIHIQSFHFGLNNINSKSNYSKCHKLSFILFIKWYLVNKHE